MEFLRNEPHESSLGCSLISDSFGTYKIFGASFLLERCSLERKRVETLLAPKLFMSKTDNKIINDSDKCKPGKSSGKSNSTFSPKLSKIFACEHSKVARRFASPI